MENVFREMPLLLVFTSFGLLLQVQTDTNNFDSKIHKYTNDGSKNQTVYETMYKYSKPFTSFKSNI